MDTPKKVIVDLSKPKGERESIVELTAEEIAERETQAAEAEAQRLVEEEAQAAQEAAKVAAHEKLAALGLTPEEIAAITK